jgi:ribosome-binding factor A
MGGKRTDKLNSLLQQVISEVIRNDVKNPHVNEFVSVTKVEITKDLRHAKVFVSVIGDKFTKETTVIALQSAAGFIAVHASKKMVIRHFPELHFKLDDTVEKQMRIDSILENLKNERMTRPQTEESIEDDSGTTTDQ